MELLDEKVATPEMDVVRLIIEDDIGKILLVKEVDDPNWKLPGGKSQPGETAYIAAQREALEELGLKLQRKDINKVVKAHIPNSEYYRYIIKLKVAPNQLQTTTEVESFMYFNLDGLPNTKFAGHITSAVKLTSD